MSIFEQRESAIRAYCRVYPVVFDKAINARQIDENGREYIDFFAGAGVLNFGHNNQRMTEAVIEYIQNISPRPFSSRVICRTKCSSWAQPAPMPLKRR